MTSMYSALPFSNFCSNSVKFRCQTRSQRKTLIMGGNERKGLVVAPANGYSLRISQIKILALTGSKFIRFNFHHSRRA